MNKNTIGYYENSESKLLNDLDNICSSMRNEVALTYGFQFSEKLFKDINSEYHKLIPHIPHISGIRAGYLNKFLIITCQEMAVYKAMKNNHRPASEAWLLCHKTITKYMQNYPKWKLWVLQKIMFSTVVRKIIRKRQELGQIGQFGDFEIEYLVGDKDSFDFGVNYRKCGNYNFAIKHGCAEFAPYICMSDIALSNSMGWGLTRTQTLSDGCEYCDFRFKKGGKTNISSKTPEVDRVIKLTSDYF